MTCFDGESLLSFPFMKEYLSCFIISGRGRLNHSVNEITSQLIYNYFHFLF